jgi:hypothetical protein
MNVIGVLKSASGRWSEDGPSAAVDDAKQRRLIPCRAVANVYTSASRRAFRSSNTSFAVCFDRTFHCWHGICSKGAAMPKIDLRDHDTTVEPAPRFATDAEIKLAEQLRCQLEERYLSPTAASSPLPVGAGEVH